MTLSTAAFIALATEIATLAQKYVDMYDLGGRIVPSDVVVGTCIPGHWEETPDGNLGVYVIDGDVYYCAKVHDWHNSCCGETEYVATATGDTVEAALNALREHMVGKVTNVAF